MPAPVVNKGHVVAKETVRPDGVSAEALHDEEVVKFVPLFGRMHL